MQSLDEKEGVEEREDCHVDERGEEAGQEGWDEAWVSAETSEARRSDAE